MKRPGSVIAGRPLALLAVAIVAITAALARCKIASDSAKAFCLRSRSCALKVASRSSYCCAIVVKRVSSDLSLSAVSRCSVNF